MEKIKLSHLQERTILGHTYEIKIEKERKTQHPTRFDPTISWSRGLHSTAVLPILSQYFNKLVINLGLTTLAHFGLI